MTYISMFNSEIPDKFHLSQNYPNPFNPSTTIRYSLNKSGFIKLILYDITGREVYTLVSEEQVKGNYEVILNAGNLTSGIYIYSLFSNNVLMNSKKCLLIK
ncbi:MAG: T9SS type A sorting domain-containing protein [Ignavibacteria bacterium]|nr:T9SS type A sorting domain-containing protein [Ignavibacteria bacterium]